MGTMIAAVYMKFFLKESHAGSTDDNDLTALPQIASAWDMIALLRSRLCTFFFYLINHDCDLQLVCLVLSLMSFVLRLQ